MLVATYSAAAEVTEKQALIASMSTDLLGQQPSDKPAIDCDLGQSPSLLAQLRSDEPLRKTTRSELEKLVHEIPTVEHAPPQDKRVLSARSWAAVLLAMIETGEGQEKTGNEYLSKALAFSDTISLRFGSDAELEYLVAIINQLRSRIADGSSAALASRAYLMASLDRYTKAIQLSPRSMGFRLGAASAHFDMSEVALGSDELDDASFHIGEGLGLLEAVQSTCGSSASVDVFFSVSSVLLALLELKRDKADTATLRMRSVVDLFERYTASFPESTEFDYWFLSYMLDLSSAARRLDLADLERAYAGAAVRSGVRAIRFAPKDAVARNEFGLAYYRLALLDQKDGQWAKATERLLDAIGQFERASSLDSTYPYPESNWGHALYKRGEIAREQGRTIEAEEYLLEASRHYERSTDLDPADSDNWWYLGWLFDDLADIAESRGDLKQSSDLRNRAEENYARAREIEEQDAGSKD